MAAKRKDPTVLLIDDSVDEKNRLARELQDSKERNSLLEQRVLQWIAAQKRLRALVADLTLTQERERRRLATNLHDNLTQLLAAARMSLVRAKQLACDPKLLEALADTDAALQESLSTTRTLMMELSPRVLYELGLPAALEALAEQMQCHGLAVTVNCQSDGAVLNEKRSILLFQCARELLLNVVKHAGAKTATLFYAASNREVLVAVSDEGKGFDSDLCLDRSTSGPPFGLFSVRERIEAEGGRFEVKTAPGQGTKVTVTLPLVKTAVKQLAKLR
jgi:signal transduction histidine kinase